MYYDYFGLKQPPFRITPDTSLFYPGGDRGAVLEALVYAILNGEGMVKVVGEVGSGKTMLCRMLEKELPEKVEVVYLANPSLSPENILHAIAFELKLPVEADTSRLQVMHLLQEYLLGRHAENRQVVVFVEEAQAMPIATLEEIRLLSNLETQQSKLLQIVLFGQPELDVLIAKPEIRQLKERITYSFQLNPFVSEHIRDYLNTRLRASGYRSGEIFNKAAIRKIGHYSKGLLRRVNILADKSLLAAYAANTNVVTAVHVEQAARDSEFVSKRRRWLWISLITASVLLLTVVLLGLWQWQHSEELLAAEDAAAELKVPQKETAKQAGQTPDRVFEVSTNIEKEGAIAGTQDEDPALKQQAPTAKVKARTIGGGGAEVRATQVENADAAAPQSATVREQTAVVASAAQARVDAKSSALPEGQILDLSVLFELQDLSDSRLSTHESAMLRKQLKDLPPEVALYQDSAQFSDICKLCWSILYRPVMEAENL